jgi:hypothetical protein
MINSLELLGEEEFGPCRECGGTTQRVWGIVRDIESNDIAVYYIQWEPTPCTFPATYDLVFKEWNQEDEKEEKVVISLSYRNDSENFGWRIEDGNQIYLIEKLADRIYTRDQVIEFEELKDLVFEICDFIYYNDPRVENITTRTN